MRDVLFVKTSSLGDVIHHFPAVTDVARAADAPRIAWVVEEAFAPLVRLHPAVDRVIPVASRRWRRALGQGATWREAGDFLRALRARRFDAVVDTQGLLRSALIARAARGVRHGYDLASIREKAAAPFYDVRHRVDRALHAVTRNRQLTALALGLGVPGGLDYGLERSALRGAGAPKYAVLLHATARAEKFWPHEGWVAVGEALGRLGFKIMVPFGNAQEEARSRALAAALPGASVPPRRPLDEVARLLAGASVVVGVDTGLLHLAAALGVPLVAIFVATEPGLTGPIGPGPMAVVGGRGVMPPPREVIAALERIG